MRLARFKNEFKKYDWAHGHDNRAIRLNPQGATAFRNCGDTYAKRGEYDLVLSENDVKALSWEIKAVMHPVMIANEGNINPPVNYLESILVTLYLVFPAISFEFGEI